MSITLNHQQDAAVLAFRDWYKNVAPAVAPSGGNFEDYHDGPFHPPQLPSGEAPYFLLEGYAGTGKSTILPFLIEAAGLTPTDCLFVAPTGKASKVMTKMLAKHGMSASASTIHRAIYRPKALQAYTLETMLGDLRRALASAEQGHDIERIKEVLHQIRQIEKDLNRAYDIESPNFQLNVENPAIYAAKLIVCDECSMVGADIAEDLRSFGRPILSIGDPGQLQPVGDLPGFCNRLADRRLTEIHRQAADNPIIWASMLIRNGEAVPRGNHGDGLLRVISRKNDDVTFDLDRDAQIIVGTNNTRARLTRKLRNLCGFEGEGPAQGEMMIVTKNSRQYPTLVNGTMLMVTSDTGTLESGDITFQAAMKDEDGIGYLLNCVQQVLEETYLGKGESTSSKRAVFHAKQITGNHQIDWAYAITAHKSQGSQWNEAVVHDESGCFRKEAQKWLYTAVTRAAERLTIIQ